MDIFNEKAWLTKIGDPRWFLDVPPLLKALSELHAADRPAYQMEKERIYQFFEDALASGKIALGKNVGGFDTERKPVDTIVIHHTSSFPGMTPERLSAIELVRLYAPQFAKENRRGPLYSGHVRGGRQIFWPYHWFVREDGACERLLLDAETGWQAGNWEINCRSVAICLDADFEHGAPPEHILRATAGLIKKQYPHVSKDRIFGHREVNPKTTCPSNHFLGEDGWKKTLLGLL